MPPSARGCPQRGGGSPVCYQPELSVYQITLLLTLLAAVEASRAHHVAHVSSHYGLHHLTGAFELLE